MSASGAGQDEAEYRRQLWRDHRDRCKQCKAAAGKAALDEMCQTGFLRTYAAVRAATVGASE